MGTISGCIQAKCTECKCRLVWHMDNKPVIGSEIIGRCSDCLEEKDHDCVDEFQGEHGEVIGRKVFIKNKSKGYEKAKKGLIKLKKAGGLKS